MWFLRLRFCGSARDEVVAFRDRAEALTEAVSLVGWLREEDCAGHDVGAGGRLVWVLAGGPLEAIVVEPAE